MTVFRYSRSSARSLIMSCSRIPPSAISACCASSSSMEQPTTNCTNSTNSWRVTPPACCFPKRAANRVQWSGVTFQECAPVRDKITGTNSSADKTWLPSVSSESKCSRVDATKSSLSRDARAESGMACRTSSRVPSLMAASSMISRTADCSSRSSCSSCSRTAASCSTQATTATTRTKSRYSTLLIVPVLLLSNSLVTRWQWSSEMVKGNSPVSAASFGASSAGSSTSFPSTSNASNCSMATPTKSSPSKTSAISAGNCFSTSAILSFPCARWPSSSWTRTLAASSRRSGSVWLSNQDMTERNREKLT
mmetsp:Transcript_94003/g.215072  ORF Transcript_94003/g.215072 Transcript_94003/m.215072 type:complete len:308 (-) Transcript_94003:2536-3459(-)